MILTKIFNNRQKAVVEKHISKRDYSRLKKRGESRKEMLKLHIGCGPRVLKGWINLDLEFTDYKPYMKYYGNKFYGKKVRGSRDDFYAINLITEGLPLPDNSVEVVFHEDFIEHLDQKECIILLAETLRVLKSGGVHRINTPNLAKSMKQNSNFKLGKKGVYEKEWSKYVHKQILTPNILKELALLVGYTKVVFGERDKSISPLIPKEYRPGDDRPEDGNIFADLIK